jgi:hypothetical protein
VQRQRLARAIAAENRGDRTARDRQLQIANECTAATSTVSSLQARLLAATACGAAFIASSSRSRSRSSADEHVLQRLRCARLRARNRNAAGHELGKRLRIQRLAVRLGKAVGMHRLIACQIVFVGCAERVQQLVRDDGVVRASHAGVREYVHDSEQAFLQAERMRQRGRDRRIVIQHEQLDVRRRTRRRIDAPRPVPHVQTPQDGGEAPPPGSSSGGASDNGGASVRRIGRSICNRTACLLLEECLDSLERIGGC